MSPKYITTLSLLNDLKHSASEAMERKRKLPSLLLWYSFIDICASLASENKSQSNRECFTSFIKKYATMFRWESFKPFDLWAARSSLLHSYSPLGNHTGVKENSAKAIFYYAWPETEEKVQEVLISKNYQNFVILDITTIKVLAICCYNELIRRAEEEPEFMKVFISNSEHLLKDLYQHGLEMELNQMEHIIKMNEQE